MQASRIDESRGRRASAQPTGVAHLRNRRASRTRASTTPAGIAHLQRQASRIRGAWFLLKTKGTSF
jgi:hypothetical protein